MSSSITTKLKSDTAVLHAEIERKSCLSELMAADVTIERYHQLLAQMSLGYRAWQRQIDAFCSKKIIATFLHIDLHNKSLKKELSQSGAEYFSHSRPKMLTLNTIEDYLGSAYVFKGSMLGARMILAHLGKLPQINQQSSLEYFQALAGVQGKAQSRADNADNSPTIPSEFVNWKVWKEDFDQYCVANHCDSEQVVHAAKQCFKVVGHWFELEQIAHLAFHRKNQQALV